METRYARMAWNTIFGLVASRMVTAAYTDTKKQHSIMEITFSGGEYWIIFLARIVCQRDK
jgi:hypothetical protein